MNDDHVPAFLLRGAVATTPQRKYYVEPTAEQVTAASLAYTDRIREVTGGTRPPSSAEELHAMRLALRVALNRR